MIYWTIAATVATMAFGVLNVIQWIQHKIERGGLMHTRVAVNQLLAHCNDASEKGLIGIDNRDKTFVNSMGHSLRGIERQIDQMLGMGMEVELRSRAGGRCRRFLRWLFPLAAVPYDKPVDTSGGGD